MLACAVVGARLPFLSQHYGAPVMLFALLLGMAMNFLSADGACRPGIEFTRAPGAAHRRGPAGPAHHRRAGRGAGLGSGRLLVVVSVVLTIVVSMLAARLLGFRNEFGLLTGGATAICGASAALALSGALPAHPQKERATLFTVIGVSALSTLAMMLYPMLAQASASTARGRHVPGRHHPRRGAGGGRGLQPCRTETGDTATWSS